LYGTLLSPTGYLTVNLVDCAQQPNLQDCGLFAAAILFEWVTESVNTPLRINFTLLKMRPHLALCLERELVEPFPRGHVSKRRKAGSAASRQVVL